MTESTAAPPRLRALALADGPTVRSRVIRGSLAAAFALVPFPVAADQASAATSGASATSPPAQTTASGGATFVKRPPRREIPGAKARITRSGLAIPPAGAPAAVKAAIRAGNRIAKKPYKWGGGHARLVDTGYDCSGSVSYALRGGRLMTSSMASTGFMSWGRRGPGRWITVRANGGHVYMLIAGVRFDTSAHGVGGSRWTAQMRSPSGFRATHPIGL